MPPIFQKPRSAEWVIAFELARISKTLTRIATTLEVVNDLGGLSAALKKDTQELAQALEDAPEAAPQGN